jgi:hypothetical protein
VVLSFLFNGRKFLLNQDILSNVAYYDKRETEGIKNENGRNYILQEIRNSSRLIQIILKGSNSQLLNPIQICMYIPKTLKKLKSINHLINRGKNLTRSRSASLARCCASCVSTTPTCNKRILVSKHRKYRRNEPIHN